MLFQQNNTTLCREHMKGKVGDGDERGSGLRYTRPLIVTNVVKWTRLCYSYSVAQGKQLLPLTHKHTQTCCDSPGKCAASEQASVTHSSKNKLGSCENKAWEPWYSGVVKGVGSMVVRGEPRGHSLAATGGQGNSEWQVQRQRAETTLTVCPPRLLCFLLKTQAAWGGSYQDIVETKALPSICLNIHIHCIWKKRHRLEDL